MDELPTLQSLSEDTTTPETFSRPDAIMKVSVKDWTTIRALAEAGESYASIAERYPLSPDYIKQKSNAERWITPNRLAKAARGRLAADDPATAIAHLWKERGQKSRDDTYKNTSKALERFYACSPVPTSFQEAAIAKKMLDDSISPKSEQDNKVQVNLAILTSKSFSPTSSHDDDIPDTIDI